MDSKTAKKTENSGDRIRNTLLEMLLSQDISDIPAKELAEKAGIARSTFYTYYDSPFSVLQDMEDKFFEGMATVTAPYRTSTFDDCYFYVAHPLTIDVLRFARNHALLLRSMFGRHGDERFLHKLDVLLRKDLAESAIASGYLRIGANESEAVSTFIVNGHRALLSYIGNHPNDIEETRMAVLTYRMLYGPFRKWDSISS